MLYHIAGTFAALIFFAPMFSNWPRGVFDFGACFLNDILSIFSFLIT